MYVCVCVEILCPLNLLVEIRDLKSLEKSAGKKWSQNWTFLLGSSRKLPRKKSLFFCWFFLTKLGGNHASRWIRDLWLKGILQILAYLQMFLSFLIIFFRFFIFLFFFGFCVFLIHPTVVSMLLSAWVERFYVVHCTDLICTAMQNSLIWFFLSKLFWIFWIFSPVI